MDDPHRSILQSIFAAVRRVACEHPMATLNEGFVKVVAAEAALAAGAVLLEGSNRPGMAYELRLNSHGGLHARHVPLPASRLGEVGVVGKPRGTVTPDLRLSHPAEAALEIKTRCDYGSSRGNPSSTLRKDLELVAAGDVDALLVLSDEQVYRNLRSDRPDARGRPRARKDSALLDACFPNLDGPPAGEAIVVTSLGEFAVLHERLKTNWHSQRQLVVLINPRSGWWTPAN